MNARLLTGLVAASLLFLLGCKEPTDGTGGSTGGTTGAALYAFDSTSSTVFVWTDLAALYTTTTTATPTRTLSSSAFNKVTNLAWGGLCLDSSNGILYLVSEDGIIVRVKNLRSQSGSVTSTDVVNFQLTNSSFLSTSKFGQVAIDPSTNTLYITENASSTTRIWVVPNASSQLQDASVPLQALQVTGDTGGYSVAAGGGAVYAALKDGNGVGIDLLGGPRLRKGGASGFTTANTIIGSATTLGIYGSLAFDTANSYLYVARHNTDAASTLAPIQVFRNGQFGSSYNQAPSFTLGSTSAQADLRVIAHGGSKDWLVGLSSSGTTTPTGFAKIHVWKSPLGGVAAVTVNTTSGAVLKGLAVDGNAS